MRQLLKDTVATYITFSGLLMLGGLALSGCVDGIPDGENPNKWDMYRTLAHYKYIDRDTLKYAAAKFLIDNMQYHGSNVRISKDNDTLARWRHATDSIYYSLVGNHSLEDFPWDSLRKAQKERRSLIEADTLPDPMIDHRWLPDLATLDYRFLTDHIDNAFHVWHTSPFARGLTFDEFKEYILPYRCVEGYGFHETGKTYRDLFAKYVMADTTADLRTTVQYYNTTIGALRDLNGKTHRSQLAGIYDLYSRDFHDCVDIASYGCNILRACGMPVVVEYNVCYRSLPGRHYHCCVYNDSTGIWQTFNAESSLPGDGDWAFAETANVYRTTFAAQKDTPPFLKADGEYVPEILNRPCVKDVTAHLLRTTTITLPFRDRTSCRLAYLATFYSSQDGLIPVTWGAIDKAKRVVTFKHAIPGVLYFPVYYPGKGHKAFGNPFFIEMVGNRPIVRQVPHTDSKPTNRASVTITRKYPQKENMRTVAEELVGGRFIGSKRGDFTDAVTLLEITSPPPPALLTYRLNHVGRYKSYRFQTTEDHPHAHISMLEWLTPATRGYANTMQPLRRHVLSSADTLLLAREAGLVRLMDTDSWDQMSWKAEYDGNMQTAPSPYPNITLSLKEPQVVTHVRFSPKNADNGIHAGDVGELFYWDNGWRSCGTVVAQYEYMEFADVPLGKIYWLRVEGRGQEEMPFVLDGKGRQRFLYGDIVKHAE